MCGSRAPKVTLNDYATEHLKLCHGTCWQGGRTFRMKCEREHTGVIFCQGMRFNCTRENVRVETVNYIDEQFNYVRNLICFFVNMQIGA